MPEQAQYKFVENLQDGIRLDKRADSMPDGGGTIVDNVTLRDGVMAVDKGYTQFLGAIDGTPQLIFQMRYANGTADLILVTTSTVYEKLSGEWNYAVDALDGTTQQVTTLAYASGASGDRVVYAKDQPNVTVVATLGFTAGDYIGVRYQSGDHFSITGIVKGSETTYTFSKIAAWDIGNNLYFEGFTTTDYNGYQTITDVSFNVANQTMTIKTNLNSTSLGATGEASSGSRKAQRADQTQEHKTKIDSINTSTKVVTLVDNLPGAAVSGARFVRRPALAGDTNFIPDHIFIPSWVPTIVSGVTSTKAGATILTNAVETPFLICPGPSGVTVRKMSLTKVTTSPYLTHGTSGSNSLTGLTAKTVCLFRGKLIFGRTTENGTVYGHRVRMSRTADFENFTADNGGEVYDLLEGDSTINSVRELNKILLVYKQNSIIRGDFIGGVNASTRFQTVVKSEGAISTHAVIDAPTIHYVVGTKNIYRYDGGSLLQAIGDGIREELFTPQRFANLTMKEFIHCTYDPEFQELLVFYPEGSVKGMRKAYRFSEQNKAWSKRTFAHYITYASMLKSNSTVTWNGLRNQWYAGTPDAEGDPMYPQPWAGAFFIGEKVHRFMLSQGTVIKDDGSRLSVDPIVYDQNNVKVTDDIYIIPWQYDSKDYYVPNKMIRVEWVDAHVSGDDITLWVRDYDNVNQDWIRVKTLDAGASIKQQRIYINKAAKRIRFRLKGRSINFQAGWFGFSFIPEFSW